MFNILIISYFIKTCANTQPICYNYTTMENNTQEELKNVVPNTGTPINNNEQKLTTPMAIVIAGFLIMVGIYASNAPAKSKFADQVNPNTNSQVAAEVKTILNPVTANDHILGDIKTAKVTIVEFSDLECPFCKTFHSTLQSAYAKYPGQIAWVYRHFPLDSIHPKTRMEARASECAAAIGGNDAFWKYVDLIFATTPSNNKMDPALLPTFAAKIGLDKDFFASCLASTKLDQTVENQYQDGLRAGVQGTPHTIVILPDGTQIPIKGADSVGLNKLLDTVLK